MNKKEYYLSLTKKLGLEIINFISKLPNNLYLKIISNQIIRSSISVGANYRAACKSRSKAEFISKMSIVEEEADETLYWLELIESLTNNNETIARLKSLCNHIISFAAASKKTAKKNIEIDSYQSSIVNCQSKKFQEG